MADGPGLTSGDHGATSSPAPNGPIESELVSTEKTSPAAASKPRRPQRPNYNQIHAKPLPVTVHPIPTFIPHSPLSFLRIAYTLLHHYFSPPPSHPLSPYIGYFSSETRSIHVTDPIHVRALWEMGFFGKGTLSRSEPSWLDRERARRKAGPAGVTSEEATRKRREERKLFKLERARVEREQIEEQLRQERGLDDSSKGSAGERREAVRDPLLEQAMGLGHVFPWENGGAAEGSQGNGLAVEPRDTPLSARRPMGGKTSPSDLRVKALASFDPGQRLVDQESAQQKKGPEIDTNQEHLQLTLEEAFFLGYGLGVLQIQFAPQAATAHNKSLTNQQLFTLCRSHSYFPPSPAERLRPDDPFLLHYVVYHHFRSLGWVIRPGVKFSVDFLLYNRGPVFSHAEFGVMIVPEYSQEAVEAGDAKQSKDWWWLHCVNRVQSQVRKSLVICYVEVPATLEMADGDQLDISAVLKQYRVREFVLRRWLANRSRD